MRERTQVRVAGLNFKRGFVYVGESKEKLSAVRLLQQLD
jgi:hypothetical protein